MKTKNTVIEMFKESVKNKQPLLIEEETAWIIKEGDELGFSERVAQIILSAHESDSLENVESKVIAFRQRETKN